MEARRMHHTAHPTTSHRYVASAPRCAQQKLSILVLGALAAWGCSGPSRPSDAQTIAQRVSAPISDGGISRDGGVSKDAAAPPASDPPERAFVEDDGVDCAIPPLPTFGDLQVLRTLPDPFLGVDGTPITQRADWRCRRQQIRRLAERFIYGEKPARPESVSGSVSSSSITVNVDHQGQSVSFGATIALPAGATGPVPAVIGYGGSSFRDVILGEGIAFITYNVGAVGDETTRSPKQGAFYTANPDRQSTGMLAAWAWGVSRILDVLEASGGAIIDPKSVGVTGCSRSGKGAFIAGAFDERVALTIPFESGMAGVPAFRLIVPEGGEVLRNAIEYRPWAGDAYAQFLQLTVFDQGDTEGRERDNQASGELQFLLPVDTHEVIGMIAPRGLFVMGNPHIVNLAPRSENITVQAGAEIYRALGARDNISYSSNTANGNHCSFREEFVPLLQQNLRKFLLHDASAATGALDAHANVAAELGPNIEWETPTLE
jgi:hypothetical protein